MAKTQKATMWWQTLPDFGMIYSKPPNFMDVVDSLPAILLFGLEKGDTIQTKTGTVWQVKNWSNRQIVFQRQADNKTEKVQLMVFATETLDKDKLFAVCRKCDTWQEVTRYQREISFESNVCCPKCGKRIKGQAEEGRQIVYHEPNIPQRLETLFDVLWTKNSRVFSDLATEFSLWISRCPSIYLYPTEAEPDAVRLFKKYPWHREYTFPVLRIGEHEKFLENLSPLPWTQPAEPQPEPEPEPIHYDQSQKGTQLTLF